MGLKVLTIAQWIISHIFLIGGLVLITIGLANGTMLLNIIGIWALAIGMCLAIGFSFKKLVEK
ncbi:hypothetical protein ISS37_05555 [candidate division KSB1 bacterium]|nr:hypothetical protein [candidate division KSB1 bacterium]